MSSLSGGDAACCARALRPDDIGRSRLPSIAGSSPAQWARLRHWGHPSNPYHFVIPASAAAEAWTYRPAVMTVTARTYRHRAAAAAATAATAAVVAKAMSTASPTECRFVATSHRSSCPIAGWSCLATASSCRFRPEASGQAGSGQVPRCREAAQLRKRSISWRLTPLLRRGLARCRRSMPERRCGFVVPSSKQACLTLRAVPRHPAHNPPTELCG